METTKIDLEHLRKCDSKWLDMYEKVKSVREATVPIALKKNSNMNTWLCRQRKYLNNNTRLCQLQRELIEGITVGGRDSDFVRDEKQLSKLKVEWDALRGKDKTVARLPGSLQTWISRQKKKYRNNKMRNVKIINTFDELGIARWGGMDYNTRQPARVVSTPPEDGEMQSLYTSILEFRRTYGDTDVPAQCSRNPEGDSDLQKRIVSLRKKTIGKVWEDRLTNIKFQWKCKRGPKKKLRRLNKEEQGGIVMDEIKNRLTDFDKDRLEFLYYNKDESKEESGGGGSKNTKKKKRVIHEEKIDKKVVIVMDDSDDNDDTGVEWKGMEDRSVVGLVLRKNFRRLRYNANDKATEKWLDDSVINGFLKLAKERDKEKNSEKCVFLHSSFATKLFDIVKTGSPDGYDYNSVAVLQRYQRRFKDENIFQHEMAFIPVNVSDQHWVLLVIFIQEKKIKLYDSLNYGGLDTMVASTFRYLKEEHRRLYGNNMITEGWTLEAANKEEDPQQSNGKW